MIDWTITKLADTLDGLWAGPPSTAGLGMLDEATTAYRGLSPEVAAAHDAFRRARLRPRRRLPPLRRRDAAVERSRTGRWSAGPCAAGY